MVNKPSSMVAGWVYHKPFMVALLVGGKSWAELNPHDFRGTKIKNPPPQRPAAQRLQCLCPALIAACDESTAGQRSNFQPLHPQLLWNSPAKNQGKKTWMKQWVNEDMGLPSPSYTCIDHVKTYTYIHIRLYITICSMHLYIYIGMTLSSWEFYLHISLFEKFWRSTRIVKANALSTFRTKFENQTHF